MPGADAFLILYRKTNDDTDGLVKVLVEKDTDKILGGHIVRPLTAGRNIEELTVSWCPQIASGAGDLIAELVLAMEYVSLSLFPRAPVGR